MLSTAASIHQAALASNRALVTNQADRQESDRSYSGPTDLIPMQQCATVLDVLQGTAHSSPDDKSCARLRDCL